MGCFFGCFGFTKKRRRPKSSSTASTGSSPHQVSYVPLESDIISVHRGKLKEISSGKTRKKVSFNLNVEAYEPLQHYESDSCTSEAKEEATWELKDEQELQRNVKSNLINISHPANYRYQNCRDSYDEEDEITMEDSDFEDEGLSDYDSNEDDHSYASEEVDETAPHAQMDEEITAKNIKSSQIEKEMNEKSRIHSVLTPVENLTQWKAIKARAKRPKENPSSILEQENQVQPHTMPRSGHVPMNSRKILSQSKPQRREITVDASLSNWLL